jgi:hypothetical protein
MVNRRLWIGALGVAAILVVASVIYVLVTPPEPQPSIAAQMALLPTDLGANWSGNLQDNPIIFPVDSTYYKNASSYSRNVLWNGTDQYSFQVVVWLICWNTTLDANHSFEQSLKSWGGNNRTFVNVTVGDRTYLFYSADYQIEMAFLKGNIECDLFADGGYGNWGRPWWIDTTIWVAQMQLDKIDQYLAQHPGAS